MRRGESPMEVVAMLHGITEPKLDVQAPPGGEPAGAEPAAAAQDTQAATKPQPKRIAEPMPGGGWAAVVFVVAAIAGPMLLALSLDVSTVQAAEAAEQQPVEPAEPTPKPLDPDEVDIEKYLDRSVKDPEPREGEGFFGIPTN